MTFEEARKLRRGRKMVGFAGQVFKFIRMERLGSGPWLIVIEDEPGHYDRLLMTSCVLVRGGE